MFRECVGAAWWAAVRGESGDLCLHPRHVGPGDLAAVTVTHLETVGHHTPLGGDPGVVDAHAGASESGRERLEEPGLVGARHHHDAVPRVCLVLEAQGEPVRRVDLQPCLLYTSDAADE